MKSKLFSFLFLFVCFQLYSYQGTLVINANPSDAEIWADGKLIGTGQATIKLKKVRIIKLEIKRKGYIAQTAYLKYNPQPGEVMYKGYGRRETVFIFTLEKEKSSEVVTQRNSTSYVSDELYASKVSFSNLGKYYAIVIGISEYSDPSIPDLDSLPIKDASKLSKVLSTNYNFEKENIVELYNPTRRDIVTAMDALSKKVTSSDNLLIFYAGHGHYEQSNDIGYWLPSDAEVNNPSNWLYNDQLVADIKKIKSLHTLLISDACFSGSIFKTRQVNMENADEFVKRKYELPSRKAITSGTLKSVPNASVFMKYLLDRLSNNTSDFFSSSQLFQSIEQPVVNNSKNLPQYGVMQNVGDEGGDFIFVKRK